MLRDLNQCIEISINANYSKNYDCDIILNVDGVEYKAYSVDIAFRELGFNCENDTYLTYDVNSQGFNNVAVLYEVVG